VDGFEATRIIRSKEVSGRIPIIAQTAHAFAEDKERCKQAGMDGHVSKPINSTELLRVLQRYHLSSGRSLYQVGYVSNRIQGSDSSGSDQAPSHQQGVRSRNSYEALSSERRVLDVEALLDRLGWDLETARELAGLYFADVPGLVAKLRSAALEQDWKLVARYSHVLKGASANLGAMALAALAAEIEQASRDPRRDRLQGLLSRIDHELNELKLAAEKVWI
jgi:HPt (histidine-containing phosphotransfer) domain-containing protein